MSGNSSCSRARFSCHHRVCSARRSGARQLLVPHPGVGVEADHVVQLKGRGAAGAVSPRLPVVGDVHHQPRGVQRAGVADQRVVRLHHHGVLFVRLVAHRPKDHRRVVPVAPDHRRELPLGVGHLGAKEGLVLGHPGGAIDRYLAHRQQAQLVAQVQLAGVVRVMAQPHEIGAHGLHIEQVAPRRLQVAARAAQGRILVPVEPL